MCVLVEPKGRFEDTLMVSQLSTLWVPYSHEYPSYLYDLPLLFTLSRKSMIPCLAKARHAEIFQSISIRNAGLSLANVASDRS